MRVLVIAGPGDTGTILYDYTNSWGLRCAVVANAKEALAQMRIAVEQDDPYRVVITEYYADGMDAFTLRDSARNIPELNAVTKFILCTASEDAMLAEKALQSGFSAFLTKPFRQSHLFSSLMSIVNEDADLISVHLTDNVHQSEIGATATQESGAILILVVEDNPANQRVAELLLKKLGFRAQVAACGQEAIRAVQRRPYSLVLMDCQMPDLDGFETTRIIRKNEVRTGQHIPIVAMTAPGSGARETGRNVYRAGQPRAVVPTIGMCCPLGTLILFQMKYGDSRSRKKSRI